MLNHSQVESLSKNYYKVRWNYYKLRQLSYYKVRWTVITNCDSFFITKCDKVYYKLRQVLQSAIGLLQIATVHTSLMLPSVCVIGVHGSIAFYRMRSRDLSSELKERS